jgi:2'-5' RNA ligase
MNTSLETALLIVPPREVQVFSFPLREEYDIEAFNKNVPAHITLLYPFVPPEIVEASIEKLTTVCKDYPSFDVTLDRYGSFEGAIFLEPSDPEPVIRLHRHLASAFPEYPVYGGEHGPDLHPHLTLARFEDPERTQDVALPPTPSFTFAVDKLHLYLGSTTEDIAFIPRAVIPLGSGK